MPLNLGTNNYTGTTLMKKYYTFCSAIIILAICGTSFAESPHQLGPFTLGRDIAEVADFVQMDTSLPIRHMESIKEVEIKPIKGYKTGLIAYCTCAAPNTVVRIKLKYSDGSKAFYQKLKKRIDKRFGECDEYRGDPFHVVIGWKWSFMDKENNKISMILQHNSRDEDEKMGNSIKLTMTNLLESDWQCQKNKEQMEMASGNVKELQKLELEQTGWDLFVPR
jgi:hypothetical protein